MELVERKVNVIPECLKSKKKFLDQPFNLSIIDDDSVKAEYQFLRLDCLHPTYTPYIYDGILELTTSKKIK